VPWHVPHRVEHADVPDTTRLDLACDHVETAFAIVVHGLIMTNGGDCRI
jgi:hypothetical protein